MPVPTPSVTRTSARSRIDTKTIVSLAMLTAIAYIVMLLSKLCLVYTSRWEWPPWR